MSAEVIEEVFIYTDGASRQNPGPAAGAYIITLPDGRLVEGKGFFLGQATNNVAEYTGLLKALDTAERIGAKRVKIFSDSQLMVRQVNGQYRVRSPNIAEIFTQCMERLNNFRSWQITHIEREKNVYADKLANQAIDRQSDCSMPTPQDKPKALSRANLKWQPRTKKLRLGILISGGGRTMLNIGREINRGTLDAEIAVVISSLARIKGVELARQMGLDPVIIRKGDFADNSSFSMRIAEELRKAKVDLAVQAGWLCLWQIPADFENRVMNIHPALLPSFGGKGMWGHHVHEAVLKAGCRVSGCTVHFCNNQYDTGPIIIQRACPVLDNDTAETLSERVFAQECIAYPEAIRLFAQGKLTVENNTVKRVF